ncbi:DUF3833 domain-containing protein [Pseudokordiimonas caeni]|uniref:DUF3833 domain-containing protein n=1 Tax=Pseudokordiimonas caeni TaxID=2997908 RepID=UPI0028121E46|nr:DUF3833 domain-containing protein [Pseudokordiimonas caeni]
MHAVKILASLFLLTLLSACGTNMKPTDFASMTPELKLEDYFTGRTVATGLFEDRFGNVRNQFVVTIDGTWDGRTLILNEDFAYSDGTSEFRRWEIVKDGENRYSGITEQVIGRAEGETSGNAFNWQYDFNLKVGDDIWKVSFDDWMFLQPDGTLLNKATVTRWGFKIGTVFLSFRRVANEDAEARPAPLAATGS